MRCIYCGIEMDQKNEYCQCYDELKEWYTDEKYSKMPLKDIISRAEAIGREKGLREVKEIIAEPDVFDRYELLITLDRLIEGK